MANVRKDCTGLSGHQCILYLMIATIDIVIALLEFGTAAIY